MELLDVKNLSFAYPLCDTLLSSLSFSVQKGEFIAVCGATGSGKSTLLRMLKPELTPRGTQSGEIRFDGKPINELDPKDAAGGIGFVMQHPEQQIVTDKVWHELAFGLENMGVPAEEIRLLTAEAASFFGIDAWFDKDVSTLSGGQKQLLNLAAVTVMQPKLLILDEPTAQLDPIAADEFIHTLRKLNRELGITIIIAEHRLEEITPLCDRMLILENGQLLGFDAPKRLVGTLRQHPRLFCAMPAVARLCGALYDSSDDCPLTVNEGRRFVETHFDNCQRQLPADRYIHSDKPALSFRDVCFRYTRETPDVLKHLNFTVYENEIYCILGANGSGKTTALCAAADLLRIYSGNIRIFGKDIRSYKNQSLYKNCLAYLPQDVQTVFLKNTVREELEETGTEIPFDISHLYDKHPYDLSGGEQQLVALAKVLGTKPKLLLLDEPTKGIDAFTKQELAALLCRLRDTGVTIITVTHDVEFAAICADRCAMFFRGEIVSEGVPAEFFSRNHFYTTAANRMTRGYFDRVVTIEQAAALCEINRRKDDAPCL